MNQDETQRWLLETISEGGYSFKELLEYTSRNDIDTKYIVYNTKKLVEQGLVIVVILGDDDKMQRINILDGINAIENMPEISSNESMSKSKHYLEITEFGLEGI